MKPISIAEPVTDLRRIPIHENGDPLTDYSGLLRLDAPRFNYRRETIIRAPIAEMLVAAASRLPEGYFLAIVEGWRPLHIQRRMYRGVWNRFAEKYPDWSETKLKRIVNQFTAPIDARVPPPHSTGGAVDMILVKEDGSPHDHTTPYERFDQRGFPMDAPGLSETARMTRRILKEAFAGMAITNYPSEYWHWSYGDQGWAYRGGHPHALYGPIEPADYSPEVADMIDEPLILIEN